MKRFAVVLGMLLMSIIPAVLANGGCVKIADEYFVQLSSSPHVPRINEQAQMLISIADRNATLVQQAINATITLKKGTAIIREEAKTTTSGVVSFEHTFAKAGSYELFFSFTINNQTIAPEDFLIEVPTTSMPLMPVILALLLGTLIGILWKRKA